MKRLAIGLLALALSAGAVHAVDVIDLSIPMNVQRNFEAAVDQGSAETITGTKTFSAVPNVGATGNELTVTLTAFLEDLSTNSTAWLISPITGTIIAIKAVVFGAIGTSDETLRTVTSSDSNAASVNDLTLTQSGSKSGSTFSTGPADLTVNVDKDGVIGVGTVATSTSDVDATVEVVLRYR